MSFWLVTQEQELLFQTFREHLRMPDSSPHPTSVSNRVAKAKHDLRNPLGEIIGFSEILREEAVDLANHEMQAAFASLCTEAHTLLKQLDETLEIENLNQNPLSVESLQKAFLNSADRTNATIYELTALCRESSTPQFLDDLARIAAAACCMSEQASLLLGEFYQAGLNTPDQEHLAHRSAPVDPIHSNPNLFTRPPTPRTGNAPSTGAKILVADDNEANRELITRRLLRNGHVVAHASDGELALEQLRKEPFDLVLLDVLMPKVTGHQVLAAMKTDPVLRHIPVIMITGLDDMDSLISCIECGAEDYLTKPFDPVLLNARIGSSLEKKRLRDTERDLLNQVRQAQEKSEALLLNILPRSIADRLKAGESTIVDTFPSVTVLFADLAGFTELSTRISGAELVLLLNELFTTFDLLAQEQGLEKIKTIGDAYMVVGGLPVPRTDHAHAVAELALNMVAAVNEKFADSRFPIRIRIGISSGPVVAGVIGRNKFSYDLWGDTVNTASRMESYGEAGTIQVSNETYKLLAQDYPFTPRNLTQVKGKGDLTAWRLNGPRTN